MKNKLLMKLTMLFALVFSFFAMIGNKPIITYAEGQTTYEEADVVSIGDIAGKKAITMLENQRYYFDKTASHGSLIFKFDLENNDWSKNTDFQVYFVLKTDNGTVWTSENYFWLKWEGNYMKHEQENGEFVNVKSNAMSSANHSIELGRLCIMDGEEYTDKYYVYIKVDGVIIDSCINTYDYNRATNCIFITGKAENTNRLVDPDFVEPTYETPDEISVGDLTKNGVDVGNKFVMNSSTALKYDRTTTYGSIVFKFKYKNTKWTVDSDGFQINLAGTWQSDGMFWLRPDAVRISYKVNGTNNYLTCKQIQAGNHNVEVGRLAQIKNNEYTGKVMLYIKIDNVEFGNIIVPLNENLLTGNNLFLTGTNGNAIYDCDWQGNVVDFVVNGNIIDTVTTQEDYLTKPVNDPSVPGKEFVGWFDKLGNQWDFENDVLPGDLTLTAGFKVNETVDDETYFADDNFTPVIRFLVSSDTHIGSSSSIRDTRLAQEFSVAYQYAANSLTYNNLDAALYAGDVSDDGSAAALTNFKKIVDANIQNGTILIASMGNHEFRTYDSVAREVKTFEDIIGMDCDLHVIINGFHFITVSPNSEEGYHFTETKIEWLEQELAAAATADPNKPIFVMQHEGISGTIYGSDAWGMDELTETLCKYPQVVDFSGHSHYPLADPRSIWQGTFTALGTGTLHYYELGINGYKNSGVFPSDKTGGWSGGSNGTGSTGEFQIVEVDANNAMRVIVYDLNTNKEITRYYMRNLLEDRKFTYSHTERSKNAEKPYFDHNNILASVDEDTITLEFDQAKCKDVVESYRIEIYDDNGKLYRTQYALSDYFFDPIPTTIKVEMTYLEENTHYTIKVFAVNAWNQESEDCLETEVTTGSVKIYTDVVDEISLYDLLSDSGKAYTTDTLNGYKPVHFKKSEDNVYGSFILKLQLLYRGGDLQVCFNKVFANEDLVWMNHGNSNIWFIKDNYKSAEPISLGLHEMEYGRLHYVDDNNKSFTKFYVKVDGELIYTCISDRQFTNDGYFSLNFGATYTAGSRYYDMSYDVFKEEDPTFEDGSNFDIEEKITNWSSLGASLSFDSTNESLNVWLEDASGRITSNKTFNGELVLSKSGYYFHYEIKTNQFALGTGVTGNERITKICVEETDWNYANVSLICYKPEKLDKYDTISVSDVSISNNTGIYKDVSLEHRYSYAGTSPSYSAVLKYYLVCDDLDSTSEIRSQLGTLWTYFCTLWAQPGNPNDVFFGFQYTTRPTDRYTVNFKSRSIYLVETGTILVTEGEWTDYVYTYFKINNQLITGFYAPKTQCASTSYECSFKAFGGYSVADVSLGRNIQYVVDGKNYGSAVQAVIGAKIYEPTQPIKAGYYFTGWYTQETGGERVDFSKVFATDQANTVKYYARFSDTTYDVKFYNGNLEYQTQEIGKGGQALKPEDPEKTGQYVYQFVKWIDRATGKEYDFSSEVNEDVILDAYFEEHQYLIRYLVDGLEYTTRYYVESDKDTIILGEPDVPSIIGTEGYWEYSEDKNNYDIYASARYNGLATTANSSIKLNSFNGETVDIADDLTRFYLSFSDTEAQAQWIDSYPVNGGHERQDITFSWTDTSGNKSYYVYFADNANFENAFIVKTAATNIDYVGIFTPGLTYYWKVIGINNSYSSAVDTFTILDTPVRWFSADTVFNTRDIGGWTTIDGKTVNYGLIYRGGQLALDNSGEKSYMSDYSFKVFNYLGIKTEIELRGDAKHSYNQFNDLEKVISVNGNGYTQFFTMGSSDQADYRKIFTALADKSNYPLYFHCSWGADRTGGLGFLINAVLGVPYEQLVQDYELTSLSYSGRRTRYGYDNAAFTRMYERFMEDYSNGGTLQDAVYNYLLNYVGVKPEEIASLKQIMLSNGVTQLTTHTVTYKVDGEVYQQSKVFDGATVKEVTPVYIDRHVTGWTLNGVLFDSSTPVTSDLVLEAVFEETIFDDYDLITLRDLGLEEGYTPNVFVEPTSGQYTYESSSVNGGRLFIFNYKIVDEDDGVFNDGLHIEIGSNTWNYKAHVWIAGENSQHVFTVNENPTASFTYHFEYGKTYKITVGVIIPLNGPYAGQKMFLYMVDDEIISYIPTQADIASTRIMNFAGLEGKLYSVENTRTVTFYDVNGNVTNTQIINRGEYATKISNPKLTGKVFLGWFDAYGNKWDFDNNKVLVNVALYARFGEKTVSALVVDSNNIEIANQYEIVVGSKVKDLAIPTIDDSNLEFDGWFNNGVRLLDDEIINEAMNIVCKFKVIEHEDPTDPVDPDNPGDISKYIQLIKDTLGCESAVSTSFIIIPLLVAGLFLSLKKRKIC